ATYPRMDQWPAGLLDDSVPAELRGVRAARLLKQYAEVSSEPIAMLGINLVGTDDPAVNEVPGIALNSVTVAFWGPEFDFTDLAKLDEDGTLFSSGVLLYEDTNQNGVFDAPALFDFSVTPVFIDRI